MISKKKFREIVSGAPIAMPIYVEEYLYEALAKELEKEAENPTNEVIRYFVTEYEVRFNRRPTIEGKDTKRMKDAMRLSGFGPDRMKRLMLAYLEMRQEKIVEAGHSLFFFLNNLDRLARHVDGTNVVPIPRTNKPTMEIHPTPVDNLPQLSPEEQRQSFRDIMAKIKADRAGASAKVDAPAKSPTIDPHERRDQLKQQLETIKKEEEK